MGDPRSLQNAQNVAGALPSEPDARDLSTLVAVIREASRDGADADLIAQQCGLSLNVVLAVLGETDERPPDRDGKTIWTVWATETGTALTPPPAIPGAEGGPP